MTTLREIKFWKAFHEAVTEEMRSDPTVLYFGEDAGGKVGGPFALAKGLQDEFGAARVYDTPDSEAAYVGLAVGLASRGFRPIVDISFMDFTMVAMDQIVNMAAKLVYMSGGQIGRIPLVIHTMAGAGRRAGSQHSQSLEAWFAHVPGLKVAAPSNPADLKGIVKSAIRDDNPVIIMKHKAMLSMKGEVPEGDYTVPLGKASVKCEGTDVTIVAVSQMVNVALRAASILAGEGISAEVVDPVTISPLDADTIVASVSKTGRLVTLTESYAPFGVGAEVGALVLERCFDFLQGPLVRVATSFNPMPYSPGMEDFSVPDVARVVEAVRNAVRS